MANITVDPKYIRLAQPDGWTDADAVRSRLFRQTATVDGTVNAGDTLAASTSYALAKLPSGFVPRYAIVNVVKADGGSGSITLKVSKGATGLDGAKSAVTYADTYTKTITAAASSAVSLATAAKTLVPFAVVSDVGLDPFVAGASDYLVATCTAAADAEFEVVVVGDWPHLEA